MSNRISSMKTRSFSLVSAAATVALALGCNDPSDSVPAATVGGQASPTPAAAAVAQKPQATTSKSFSLSESNTEVMFIGSKVTGSHEGGFRRVSGSVTLVNEDLALSKAEIEIDMSSAYTDNGKLTRHLKSADFFDVEKFPTATFRMTAVEEMKSNAATHLLSGELTLHGQTKAISFPATISAGGGSLKARAEFSINRKDFGVSYPGMKDDLIRDGVVIKLAVNLQDKQS